MSSAFGLSLFNPVDHYTKTTRSAKYTIMFIGFTFLIFFFVEIINKRRIHPIQYLLVGFAVCLFYLLLLAISEHTSFFLAYLIACTGVIGMITLYTKSVVGNWRLTGVMFGTLVILYGFLYVLLQQEDYALLLGSIGLFITLGIVMYITRKIKWFGAESN